MTISLRNQRVRLFELQEQGADGWTKDVYVATADAWARVEPPSGGDLARFEGDDQTISIVATFALSAAIPRKGMIRVLPGGDGESDYRILSTLPRRMLQEQLVYGESMAQDSKPHDVDDSPIAVVNFSLDPSGPQFVQVGSDTQLVAAALDANGWPLAREIIFTSTSGNATVDANGLVHAVSIGFALINIRTPAAGTSVAFHVTA